MDDPGAPGATIPDAGASSSVRVLLADDFATDRRAGAVLGSTAGGHVRLGVDVEHRLGVDDGALRISPLRTPGWARCALAYGPFLPEPGLSAAVHVLNGHHASESYGIRSMRSQLLSWLRGSHTRLLARRIPELLTDRRRMPVHRRLGEWVQHWRRPPDSLLNENLAVGFFAVPAPASPDDLLAAFLVRGTGVGNGELTARVGGGQLPVAERITNISFHLFVIVREDAVTYFASALPGAWGAAPHPMMRPLAVADGRPAVPVHLGVEQNALGEIGFSVDSRVYGVRAAVLPELAGWPGTAHAADRVRGSGAFERADTGQSWYTSVAGATRTAQGVRTVAPETLLLVDPGAPSGLVRMRRAPRRRSPRPGGPHSSGGVDPTALTCGSRSTTASPTSCNGATGATRCWPKDRSHPKPPRSRSPTTGRSSVPPPTGSPCSWRRSSGRSPARPRSASSPQEPRSTRCTTSRPTPSRCPSLPHCSSPRPAGAPGIASW